MRTLIILWIINCFFIFSSRAQKSSYTSDNPSEKVYKPDTLKLSSPDTSVIHLGNKEIRIIHHDRKISETNKTERKDKREKFDGHWEGVEIGFNGFDRPDYHMYGGNEFMKLDQRKSIEVNLNIHNVNIGLYKSYVGIVSGLGFSFNNYRFEDPFTISEGSLITEPVILETENLSKTKLTVSFLQVPLLFEIQLPVNQSEGRIFINAGFIGGVKIGSYTKVKHGNIKDKDYSGFNINSFKYAATARIGYRKIGLFGSYSLTPLFESGKGPELTPFTIGLSFFGS